MTRAELAELLESFADVEYIQKRITDGDHDLLVEVAHDLIARPVPAATIARRKLLATVEHPVWCDPDRCDVFTYPGRPDPTEVFHTAVLMDGEDGRRGMVELVQYNAVGPEGLPVDVSTAVYIDGFPEDRIEVRHLPGLAAAFARAIELLGYPPEARQAAAESGRGTGGAS